MMNRLILLIVISLITKVVIAQMPGRPAFRVVPLGVKGGIDESNLSAYMVAPVGTNDYVCFDAGTINSGIMRAIAKNAFHVSPSVVLKNYIKGYFISHAHLDHVAGLIINSPIDSNKTIYGLPACINNLENSYFNGEAWSNFGDEGKGFLIKKYHFEKLGIGEQTPVKNTSMFVKAFPLSHVNPYESTAFLLQSKEEYVAYLGDTGPDSLEHSDKLLLLWQQLAPIIQAKKLHAIFIEVSYPDEQPADKLFGHLTPYWLMKEMNVLSRLVGKDAMRQMKIVITHMKPPAASFTIIKKQLNQRNLLGLQLIFPEQGKAFEL